MIAEELTRHEARDLLAVLAFGRYRMVKDYGADSYAKEWYTDRLAVADKVLARLQKIIDRRETQ